MQQGNGKKKRQSGGLNGDGNDRGPAAGGAKEWCGLDKRLLKHSAPTPSLAPATGTPQLRPMAESAPAPDLVTGLIMDTGNTSPFSSILTSVPASPHIGHGGSSTPSSSVAAGRRGPLLAISTGVSLGLLLTPIRPEYPAIAKISRTEGTVVVQAIISKSGRIESAHILSGPPILQNAALEAVRNARYRPYLLNDEPTEVETTISITFHLSS